jgi:hypothetical protein
MWSFLIDDERIASCLSLIIKVVSGSFQHCGFSPRPTFLPLQLFEPALGIHDSPDALVIARNINILPYQGFGCWNIIFGGVMEDNMTVSNTLSRVNITMHKGQFHRLQPLFLSICPCSSPIAPMRPSMDLISTCLPAIEAIWDRSLFSTLCRITWLPPINCAA